MFLSTNITVTSNYVLVFNTFLCLTEAEVLNKSVV
jgi:hypothetical protein